jgi:ABC-type uncharacterized transport system auxiliary subunit
MSQKQPTSRYYVIEPPDSLNLPVLTESSALDGYCEVAPVEVYPAYATQSIAQRRESNEIVYYSYHHWAVRPGETMTLLLEESMGRASLFEGVSTRFWKIQPAYKLETTVFHLEALRENDDMFARFSIRFRLISTRDNESLVVHQANRKERLPRKDLNLYAQTVGELFHEELQRFAQKIVERSTGQSRDGQ